LGFGGEIGCHLAKFRKTLVGQNTCFDDGLRCWPNHRHDRWRQQIRTDPDSDTRQRIAFEQIVQQRHCPPLPPHLFQEHRRHESGCKRLTITASPHRGTPFTAASRLFFGVGPVRLYRGALPSTSTEPDEALMATTHREPPNGIETAILHELRLLPRRAQEAYLDALTRLAEGQLIEECLMELLTELGYSPAEVRQQVRAAVERKGNNWREGLN
jgi:hypothetical protein